MRVLLVEDEPDLGTAIQRVLHQENTLSIGFKMAQKLGATWKVLPFNTRSLS